MSNKKEAKNSAGEQGKTIALNRSARHDYHLEARFEAGMSLLGWELKSIRAGRLNMGDSYAMVKNGEIFLFGSQITPLISASTHVIPDDRRTRKLDDRHDRLGAAAELEAVGRRLGEPDQLSHVELADGDALPRQRLDLRLQRPGVEHDAVADHRERAAHDARGQQRQLVDALADDERMAGIVPALEAHDDIGALGEPVDDLAFAFIAPLGTNHCYVGQMSTFQGVPEIGLSLGSAGASVQPYNLLHLID